MADFVEEVKDLAFVKEVKSLIEKVATQEAIDWACRKREHVGQYPSLEDFLRKKVKTQYRLVCRLNEEVRKWLDTFTSSVGSEK